MCFRSVAQFAAVLAGTESGSERCGVPLPCKRGYHCLLNKSSRSRADAAASSDARACVNAPANHSINQSVHRRAVLNADVQCRADLRFFADNSACIRALRGVSVRAMLG